MVSVGIKSLFKKGENTVINEWTIYWITRLDGLGMFFAGVSALSIISTFFACMFALDPYSRDCGKSTKVIAITLSCLVLASAFLAVLTPTTKEALMIYGIPKILNSQQGAVKEATVIPEKALKVINEYLDAQLKNEKNNPLKGH